MLHSVLRSFEVYCDTCRWQGKVSAGKRPEIEIAKEDTLDFPDPCPVCGHQSLQYLDVRRRRNQQTA